MEEIAIVLLLLRYASNATMMSFELVKKIKRNKTISQNDRKHHRKMMILKGILA